MVKPVCIISLINTEDPMGSTSVRLFEPEDEPVGPSFGSLTSRLQDFQTSTAFKLPEGQRSSAFKLQDDQRSSAFWLHDDLKSGVQQDEERSPPASRVYEVQKSIVFPESASDQSKINKKPGSQSYPLPAVS